MTSNAENNRLAQREDAARGIGDRPEFKCIKCNNRWTRGALKIDVCVRCYELLKGVNHG